jgi:hypothetical protein
MAFRLCEDCMVLPIASWSTRWCRECDEKRVYDESKFDPEYTSEPEDLGWEAEG